jgi:hypothetical protein
MIKQDIPKRGGEGIAKILKRECYKNNISRKETKKRNALLNLFPAY